MRWAAVCGVMLCAALARAEGEKDWPWAADHLCDHRVVLDSEGRLLPWASYDAVIRGSMNYIKHCPTVPTKYGDDPWYMVTSKLSEKGEFTRNQNCQGSHAYMATKTLIRYYAYCGDEEAIVPVRRMVERLLAYHTPGDWVWPNVPRTQDNSPDGEYTDGYGEPDKMAVVGVAYIKFYKLTGESKYLDAAYKIAESLASHIAPGNADVSPLPFRVGLQDGRVLAPYTSHMVGPMLLFDELIQLGKTNDGVFQAKRDLLWRWLLAYPMKNHRWANFYEDVPKTSVENNLNQQSPMETARFLLRHPEIDPDYREHVAGLLAWVADRFGKTKRYGATSIREQDGCFFEMASHTARYASIQAKWFGITQDPKAREEARASFALATYAAGSKYSQGDAFLNYVGVGYIPPWFIDSYFDYLCHFIDGMSEMPEMAPADSDHILGSDSVIRKVAYRPGRIEYTTFEPQGNERLRITFKPDRVIADGKELPATAWSYGEFRGVPGVLSVHREGAKEIVIAGGR